MYVDNATVAVLGLIGLVSLLNWGFILMSIIYNARNGNSLKTTGVAQTTTGVEDDLSTSSVREQKQRRQATNYRPFATNNLQRILDDPNGARCVYCLGSPTVDQTTETCDNSTVLCPECYIDAVVPASSIPGIPEETLRIWHHIGFGDTCNSSSASEESDEDDSEYYSEDEEEDDDDESENASEESEEDDSSEYSEDKIAAKKACFREYNNKKGKIQEEGKEEGKEDEKEER